MKVCARVLKGSCVCSFMHVNEEAGFCCCCGDAAGIEAKLGAWDHSRVKQGPAGVRVWLKWATWPVSLCLTQRPSSILLIVYRGPS